jgi:thymidylate kinase
MNLFIAIEGLDNSGKTTIGKELSSIILGEYRKALSVNIEDVHSLSSLLRHRMNHKNNAQDTIPILGFINEIEDDVKKLEILKTNTIIQDRCYYTPIAYSRYKESDPRYQVLKSLEEIVLKPDVVVFVHPGIETIYERSIEENKNDQYTETTKEGIASLLEEYEKILKDKKNVVYVSGKDLKKDVSKLLRYIDIVKSTKKEIDHA